MSDRRFVDVDGLRTRIYVHDGRPGGSRDEAGPTVVFLHGSGGNYLIWPPALRRIDGVRVIAPDLPGHGESSGEGYADVSGYATFVARLLSVLGVEHLIAIGHSLGAAIALTLAQRGEIEVAGVGVMAGGDRLPVLDDWIALDCNNSGELARRIVDVSLEAAAPSRLRATYAKRLRQIDADVIRRDLVASRAFDARPWASTIEAPALIVHGSQDRMVPLSCSRSLHERMRDSDLRVLDGAGHLFIWSHAAEVTHLVRALIERATCARGSRHDQHGD